MPSVVPITLLTYPDLIVHGTTYQIDQKVTFKDEYLRGVICVLEGLAAEASAIIVERIAGDTPKGRIADSRHTFNYAISTGLIQSLFSHQ